MATYDVGNPYETFAIEDDEVYEFCPVDYCTIQMHQSEDADLQQLFNDRKYHRKMFHNKSLIMKLTAEGDRIVVPQSLQQQLVKWYHVFLVHPGMTRLEAIIRTQFYFKGLRTLVHN